MAFTRSFYNQHPRSMLPFVKQRLPLMDNFVDHASETDPFLLSLGESLVNILKYAR